jgi:hypothetical protein
LTRNRFVSFQVAISPDLLKRFYEELERKRQAGEYISRNSLAEALMRKALGMPVENPEADRRPRYGSKAEKFRAWAAKAEAEEKAKS